LAGAGAEDIVRTPKHSIVAAVDPLLALCMVVMYTMIEADVD